MLDEPARSRWIVAENPELLKQVAYDEWAEQCTVLGPPRDATGPEDEVQTTQVAETNLEVSFLVFSYERLILVRRITG